MKLYLVRHAQREYKDYEKLTDIGIKQAKKLGGYFKNKKIDFVYCSTNERAKETLRYILPFLKNAKIVYTKELRQHSIPNKEPIETEEELHNRTKKFLNFLKRKHKNDNVLVISHKQVIISLICQILKIPFEEGELISKLHPASISVFEFKNNRLKSFRIGEITHLVKR